MVSNTVLAAVVVCLVVWLVCMCCRKTKKRSSHSLSHMLDKRSLRGVPPCMPQVPPTYQEITEPIVWSVETRGRTGVGFPMSLVVSIAYGNGKTVKSIPDTGSDIWVLLSEKCTYKDKPCDAAKPFGVIEGVKAVMCPGEERYGDGTDYLTDWAYVELEGKSPVAAQLVVKVNNMGPENGVVSLVGLAYGGEATFLSQVFQVMNGLPKNLTLNLKSQADANIEIGGPLGQGVDVPLMPPSFYTNAGIADLGFYITPMASIELQDSQGKWHVINSPPVAILDSGTTFLSTSTATADRIEKTLPDLQKIRFIFEGAKVGLEAPYIKGSIGKSDSLSKQVGGSEVLLIGLAWLTGANLTFSIDERKVRIDGNLSSNIVTDPLHVPPPIQPVAHGGGKCVIL